MDRINVGPDGCQYGGGELLGAHKLQAKFWCESVVAAAGASLGVLSLFRRDWIESLFHIDPDQHSGLVEWSIIAVPVFIALVATTLARRQFTRLGADAK